MLGTKMLKSEFNQAKYAELASWCNNKPHATIKDMGNYYEVVDCTPTEEERQAKEATQVASEYEAKFKALDDEIIRAEVIDKDNEYADELRQQREALKVEFMEKRGEL